MTDAVVIGAGHNGLVAANLLADAGWDVIVLEAAPTPGGAVRTAEVTAPGFRNDLFSAFYPFGAASPVLAGLGLERHGLRWVHAPTVVAHPRPGGDAAVLDRDIDVTAASLDRVARGDGTAWRGLYATFEAVGPALMRALLGPFPPVRAGAHLAVVTGRSHRFFELGRLALAPVRSIVEERFAGEAGRLLVTGNAMHADVPPEGVGSGLYGWLLTALGQWVGFPAPEGGAGALIDALVGRLTAVGGTVKCGVEVTDVIVRGGRAVGVHTSGGNEIGAVKAVLADVDAIALYTRLVGREHLPARVVAGLKGFQRGPGTFKVDWALAAPIPWSDPAVRPAGTVHVANSMHELSVATAQVAAGVVPDRPLLLLGQMTTTDPTRSPLGTEAAWAYTHVPQRIVADAGGDGIAGGWDTREAELFARRIEERIEAHAPGFASLVMARHVLTPPGMEAANANLVGGDLSGGTAQINQQLVFRPVLGLARAETGIARLYLASSSAHPGAGVHGACGANAARAALAHASVDRWRRRHG